MNQYTVSTIGPVSVLKSKKWEAPTQSKFSTVPNILKQDYPNVLFYPNNVILQHLFLPGIKSNGKQPETNHSSASSKSPKQFSTEVLFVYIKCYIFVFNLFEVYLMTPSVVQTVQSKGNTTSE